MKIIRVRCCSQPNLVGDTYYTVKYVPSQLDLIASQKLDSEFFRSVKNFYEAVKEPKAIERVVTKVGNGKGCVWSDTNKPCPIEIEQEINNHTVH